MKRFNLHMTYFQVSRRFLIMFGILYLLVFTQLLRRSSDSATFYVGSTLLITILIMGTYYRYALYFRNSSLVIDDTTINWHRNDEDHLYTIADISGIRLPNQLAQYYGMSYFQLKFSNSPSLNLDVIAPAYDEIVEEILEQMKKHPHLQEFVKEIEAAGL